MNIPRVILSDLRRYVPPGSCKDMIKMIFVSHSIHLVLCFRLGQFFRSIPFVGSFLGFLVEYFIRIFFSSDISCKARIGGGLIIIHGHDIVIGSKVVIGANCKILNGVTLGNKDTEIGINQQPIIGDNVVIGTGAKILGRVIVGDNVRIGANSVVINDVPSNSVAVGVPARVIIQ